MARAANATAVPEFTHNFAIKVGLSAAKGVARSLRENALRGTFTRRFCRTTDSQHRHPVAPNLLAWGFRPDAPNRVWIGDITYVWTLEGWAYLAVLLDLHSRRVVGWALRKTLSRELAIAALQKALVTRNPAAGLIHHTPPRANNW